MKITKYEIDMLDVKAADAILIHFYDDDSKKWKVVLIDAGTYESGKEVVDFVRNKYDTFYIDLAICTHCDDDHFGGFIYILEQMRDYPKSCVDIRKLVINDPGLHITQNDVKYFQKLENVQAKARKVYTSHGVNLLELVHELQAQNRISASEGMSDGISFFFEKSNISSLRSNPSRICRNSVYFMQLHTNSRSSSKLSSEPIVLSSNFGKT